MTTNDTESLFERVLAHIPHSSSERVEQAREYFAVLYHVAPSLAEIPLVAASWIRNILSTGYIGPPDIKGLAETENALRQGREAQDKRLLDIWERLMSDPASPHSRMLAKAHPLEHEMRLAAREAVFRWLAVPPLGG